MLKGEFTMKIDLHTHSYYSDGLYSPKELIELAKKQQVGCFALTDHDSVFGCDEIQKLAKGSSITVLNGMELSTEYKNKSVHIVCLFPHNEVPKQLVDFSYQKKEERKNRAIQMMNNIHEIYGLKIDIPLLLKESKVITRANMAYQLAKLNDMTLKEVEPFVDKDSKAYIPSTKLDLKEGLKFVKACGCLTILAHPCLLPSQIVEEIASFDIDGIEVYYPKNKVGDEAFFLELAKKHQLLISAGSDFHGDAGTKHAMLGTKTINEQQAKPIFERLGLRCL